MHIQQGSKAAIERRIARQERYVARRDRRARQAGGGTRREHLWRMSNPTRAVATYMDLRDGNGTILRSTYIGHKLVSARSYGTTVSDWLGPKFAFYG